MSQNQCYARGERLTLAAPIADNGGIGPISNEPLFLGNSTHGLACVAETSYTPPGSLVPTGEIAVNDVGVFYLSVTAKSSLSPSTGKAINPGDPLYVDGGTYDSVTGFTYGFTLDANSNASANPTFGISLDPVLSGVTQVVRVRLKTGS